MSEQPTPGKEQILEALKGIIAAEQVDNIAACDGIVKVDVILENTADPKRDELFKAIKETLLELPGVSTVNPGVSTKTPMARPFGQPAQAPAPQPVKEQKMPFKHILAISSGKGGVGKTTITVNLACALAKQGHKVGILDADIYGPNVGIMMGLRHHRLKADPDTQQFAMPENHGVQVISMAFLINEEQPVVWRGPMLDRAIRQFITDMPWSELDYLLIDLPPGTGDAQLTVMQAVPKAHAIIVTTPQEVAIHDSKKGLAMFQNNGMTVLGLVENMSYFECEHGGRYELFGHGGGKRAAEAIGVPFLAEIPMIAEQRAKADEGLPVIIYDEQGEQAGRFIELAKTVHQAVLKLDRTAIVV